MVRKVKKWFVWGYKYSKRMDGINNKTTKIIIIVNWKLNIYFVWLRLKGNKLYGFKWES